MNSAIVQEKLDVNGTLDGSEINVGSLNATNIVAQESVNAPAISGEQIVAEHIESKTIKTDMIEEDADIGVVCIKENLDVWGFTHSHVIDCYNLHVMDDVEVGGDLDVSGTIKAGAIECSNISGNIKTDMIEEDADIGAVFIKENSDVWGFTHSHVIGCYNLDVMDDAEVEGDLDVSGTIKTEAIEVSNIDVIHNATVQGKLDVNGTLSGRVIDTNQLTVKTIETDIIDVNGTLSAVNISASTFECTSMNVQGALKVDSMDVNGDINVGTSGAMRRERIDAAGLDATCIETQDLTVLSTFNAETIGATHVDTSNDINVGGSLNVNYDMYASRDLYVVGSLNAHAIDVNGQLTAKYDMNDNRDLYVENVLSVKDVHVGWLFTVSQTVLAGDAKIANTLEVPTATFDEIYLGDTSISVSDELNKITVLLQRVAQLEAMVQELASTR